jgi:hypothetical protein
MPVPDRRSERSRRPRGSGRETPSATGAALSVRSPATARTATLFAAALSPIAAIANGSMSAASAAAAPTFMAAIATSPDPDPRSSTRRPATASG